MAEITLSRFAITDFKLESYVVNEQLAMRLMGSKLFRNFLVDQGLWHFIAEVIDCVRLHEPDNNFKEEVHGEQCKFQDQKRKQHYFLGVE